MWPATPGIISNAAQKQPLDAEKGLTPHDHPGRRPHVSAAAASDTQTWMALLDDDILISALTLPGTHDSAAYTLAWPFVQTQKMSIAAQLDAGIRYFDLRCGLRNNRVEMVHGPSLLGLTLEQVLDTIHVWLDAHPTEGLIAQIKEDRTAERSDGHFAQAIVRCLAARSDGWLTANETPTLGELRGKVQLFRRFDGPNLGAYGIDVTRWVDNPRRPFTILTSHGVQLTIQDHYNFNDPQPLSALILEKGGNVSGLLEQAANDADANHWFVNFTSAYEFNLWHQLTPHDVAIGGYSGLRWEDGVNPRLRQFLRDRVRPSRYGIVAMDFPEVGGEDLIEKLVLSNFKPRKSNLHVIVFLAAFSLAVLILLLALAYTGLGYWDMVGYLLGLKHR